MNHSVTQPNAFETFEEIRRSVSVSIPDRRVTVLCPKPRRFGLWNAIANDQHPVRSIRWHLGDQDEICDSKAATDLLDTILTKGGCGGEHCGTQLVSSPPYICGSPPSRVANPLVQDARFGDNKITQLSPLSPLPPPPDFSLSPSSSRTGSFRANFGNKPVVRIEGFDCLDRDRRNCSIPALA